MSELGPGNLWLLKVRSHFFQCSFWTVFRFTSLLRFHVQIYHSVTSQSQKHFPLSYCWRHPSLVDTYFNHQYLQSFIYIPFGSVGHFFHQLTIALVPKHPPKNFPSKASCLANELARIRSFEVFTQDARQIFRLGSVEGDDAGRNVTWWRKLYLAQGL